MENENEHEEDYDDEEADEALAELYEGLIEGLDEEDLRPDGSIYFTDGVWLCPDGSTYED